MSKGKSHREKKLIHVMLVFVLMVFTTFFSFNKQKSKLTLNICNIGIISALGISEHGV